LTAAGLLVRPVSENDARLVVSVASPGTPLDTAALAALAERSARSQAPARYASSSCQTAVTVAGAARLRERRPALAVDLGVTPAP
jgi:hypothetical protein